MATKLRSKPVSLYIENTHDYALRKYAPDSALYGAASGDFTTWNSSRSDPNVETPRDAKFRVIGPTIDTRSMGRKELHMQLRGTVKYNHTNAFADLYRTEKGAALLEALLEERKPDGMSDDDWIYVKRYMNPLILLDLELWPSGSGAPVPMREITRSEIDNDFTPNTPASRTNILNLAFIFSSARFRGESVDEEDVSSWERFSYKLGSRTFEIHQDLALPIAAIDSLSNLVAPVATLHLGGRSIGFHGAKVELELNGKILYQSED